MKTINEAATEHVNSLCFPKNKDEFRRQTHRAYTKGVEFAQRWISVDEELPIPGFDKYYFVKGIYKHPKYGDLEWCSSLRLRDIYNGVPIWSRILDSVEPCRVTHWRYIEFKIRQTIK